jgi:hypothetical protein
MPEDLPVRKCINIMVGIIWNKINWFFTVRFHDSGSNPESNYIFYYIFYYI